MFLPRRAMAAPYNLNDLLIGTMMESVGSPVHEVNGRRGPVVEVNRLTGAVVVDLDEPYGRTAMDMNRWTKVQTVNEDSEMGIPETEYREGDRVLAMGCNDARLNGMVGTVRNTMPGSVMVIFDVHIGIKKLPTYKLQKLQPTAQVPRRDPDEVFKA